MTNFLTNISHLLIIFFLIPGIQLDKEFYSEFDLSLISNGSNVFSRDHYTGKSEYYYWRQKNCPTANEEIREKSLKNLSIIFESSAYSSDRNELGIDHLDSQDIFLMTDTNYGNSCDQLNSISTINSVDNMIEDWHKLYYKAGSFYFIVYTKRKLGLGFSPVYMFDQNFELIASWAL